ncbi:hypothetical protein AB1L88_02075 [Tautonia sp. JC769]|uniref:hypothetical protein n=1 Tax=Tautonia sp. JC769 TaxID=3232135 RepID=UPI0034592DC0
MTTTIDQLLANRLNALRSTGPRTRAGKARSARNALKHGLSRIGTHPPAELADRIADRIEQWRDAYRPDDPAQIWLFERLCAESVRLDACEHRILAARAEQADRALESWDDDRAAEVAALAARLPGRPEAIQPKLLQTRHGVLWLLDRWSELADALAARRGWDSDTRARALDLLGVPASARVAFARSGPDPDHPDSDPEPSLALVGRVIQALRDRLDTYLDARDARSRADAADGLGPDSADIRLLERYAADARRQVDRCRAELRRLQATAATDSPRTAGPVAEAPSPPPRPSRPPRPAPPGPKNTPADADRPASSPAPGVVASIPVTVAPPQAPAPRPNRRARRAQAARARGRRS